MNCVLCGCYALIRSYNEEKGQWQTVCPDCYAEHCSKAQRPQPKTEKDIDAD